MVDVTFQEAVRTVVDGSHSDPFSILGMHRNPETETMEVRAFVPGATAVTVVDAREPELEYALQRYDLDGFFCGPMADRKESFPYRLKISDPYSEEPRVEEDPYRFPSLLGEMDLHLLGEGQHWRSYEKMGAHPRVCEGVSGVSFLVWAPNALRVSVVGDFNHWDGRAHVMRLWHDNGLWEMFIPGLKEGDAYMFEIKHRDGYLLPLKADPYAFRAQLPPNTASIVSRVDRFHWSDETWMAERGEKQRIDSPLSIYEVHLGAWKRVPEEHDRFLTYLELAEQLIPYVVDMGFTHMELMPISEFPFYGSWGYQPIGLFATTSRYGTPEQFQHFVNACHQAGLGVILDWVPGHFPSDGHGLGNFDGTCLYEHEDPRKGFHPEWNTLIYNYGRNEVSNFLINNALFWCERFHIDGLRVDAVASMLYLNYAREDGEWVPNEYGENKNLDAVAFLRRFNEVLHERFPGVMTLAEESTAWPGVSRPVSQGGLGFDFKWNLGWMHDTLTYMKHDPIYRKYHHDKMSFGMMYAFSENFVLSLSHDEVVHLKGSLLARMPGDTWQQFANLRAYYGHMWTFPGKKLLFMGGEIAQGREWNHDASLDWHLLEIDWHQGIQALIRDLNRLYKEMPALHQLDCEPGGFGWVKVDNREESIFAYLRHGLHDAPPVLVVSNFTPVPREDWRFGVPEPGFYAERLNTDWERYGGGNIGNGEGVDAEEREWDAQPHSIVMTVPPLSTLILELKRHWD
ncbi:1,4-alpha-glucan branching enzyme GlgB [Sulfidibacter corallicola]|uniref:1,4-alpha-glucan branching enzyme GlgB n=1 Tax=Sulfidibacter corallicola TaxID=2818388 RepID=A0A8A4TR25_SULCO|nr:1,4-alpha-glucan branching protein GlgB [Sulfidibacter corallicola]QTD51973.1 1,4-alpha-glucan branching protein GlgB [Sulfidibacter corallicola]